MNTLAIMLAYQLTRAEALSARPDAPTVPPRPPRKPRRLPGTRRAMANGLRWMATRIEPSPACSA
jgi:hypothetical protein